MAVQAQAAPREAAAARPRREREQELLVWPDLVFVEFIAAVIFTTSFVLLSTFVDAPLLNRANLNITPNPSKAAWYLVSLQELLLHMHPALGGVIAPTLIGWLVESTGAWQLPLLIAAGYYGVSALLWLAIDPEKPLTQSLAEPGLGTP